MYAETSNIRHISRRAALAVGVALVAIAATVASASAASFSPWVPANGASFGDCSILVGPVYDDGTVNGSFSIIGGATVNCYYRHGYVRVTTQEFYSTSKLGSYYAIGTAGYAYLPNSSGTGTWIAQTGRACGSAYWKTRVTVTIPDLGTRSWFSQPAYTVASRC